MSKQARAKLSILMVILFTMLLSCPFIAIVEGAGDSKTINYRIGGFGPTLCELQVHFSWDTNDWKVGEKQHISFTLQVENVEPNVESITLNVQQIIVRLKTDKVTGYEQSYDIVNEYTSNQVTDLIWRQGYTTIMTNPRSFNYEVSVPQELSKLSADTSVELYYLIYLGGQDNYVQTGGINLHGGGTIDDTASNDGSMIGGVENPVWVTVKAQAPPYWLYIGVAAGGLGIAGITGALLVRSRKSKRFGQMPPPPPPT